jgi:hypothetical protein
VRERPSKISLSLCGEELGKGVKKEKKVEKKVK